MDIILKEKSKTKNYRVYTIDTDIVGNEIVGSLYFNSETYKDLPDIINLSLNNLKSKKKKEKLCSICRKLGKKTCPSFENYKKGKGWDINDPDEVCDSWRKIIDDY